MNAIRTLVAPTDLSALARHAVARAALLAAELHARLSLQHVVNAGALDALRHLLDADTSGMQQKLLDGVRADLEALASDMQSRHRVSADVHLSVGGVLGEIVEHADALDADLLVMGARGAGFMRELLVGSTTERVLRKTARPLLVVKQIAHEPYRRVLVPVDFSPRSLDALALARQVAPQAELVLLHAFEVPFEGKLRYAGVEEHALSSLRVSARREAVAQMNELVTRTGVDENRVRRIVVHGEATTQVLEQEQEQDCDLIVIGKRGHGLFGELLLGSVTKHILARSTADVLVCDRKPD
ncbi:universal stress protein [Thauera sp.]|jgi:nucleotide-binding universal stress UspA family protein|uniref:universal stress protein n=1 Tax=Thauera sp. TaxID=1905334 RepID=UPI00261FFF1B|nr:universal stress protein [Thauera sp.]MCK6409452.1 universal stress protein [Thauera sp.]